MKNLFKKFSLGLVASTAALAMAAVHADDFPSRDISVQVTFPPGGGTDLLARLISTPLGEALDSPVVVENKPGASGNIAARYVARSSPDGHTLLMVNSSYAVNPAVLKDIPFDPIEDLEGVVNFAYVPAALIVPEESGYESLEDYIEAAKVDGKKVFFGSCGNGTPQHLAGEMINQVAGTNLVHVPYAGCGPALNDVMANQVESALVSASSALAQIDSGKIRALAVTSKERSDLLPDVPSISELGYDDYDVNQWHGLLAPAGTPMAVKEKIAAEVQSILESEEILKRMQQLGYTIGGEGPQEFDEIVKGDIQRYKEVAESVELISD